MCCPNCCNKNDSTYTYTQYIDLRPFLAVMIVPTIMKYGINSPHIEGALEKANEMVNKLYPKGTWPTVGE